MVSPIATVGFVGLGRMGLPMARHVLAGGFAVTGFDLDEAAVREAEALGVRRAASCAEVAAGADLVLVIVPTDDDVLAACRGPEGAIAAAPSPRRGPAASSRSAATPGPRPSSRSQPTPRRAASAFSTRSLPWACAAPRRAR